MPSTACRALCLLAVMAYHGTFSWAGGGFLGVSTFFTLSGFLITSLLLRESVTTGGIALGRFWAGRARRLLPAAGITLVMVVVLARAAATSTQLAGLRSDLWASFGLAVNWRLALSGRAYAGYAASASPVQHMWSLAVEEQFYLLLPPTVLVLGWVARKVGWPLRWILGPVAALLAVASTATLLSAVPVGGDVTWAYYATHTRAAELLAGVVLACVLHRTADWELPSRKVSLLALVGAAVVVGWWVTAEQAGRALYTGGLTIYTLGSVAVITGCIRPTPVQRVLDVRPLRWVGRVSYGAYLFHWPLFSWLTADRLGVDGVALFAIQTTITLALAGVSAHLIEEPIRRRRLLPRVHPAALAGVVAVSLVATLGVPPNTADRGPSGIEVTSGERVAAAAGATQTLPPTTAARSIEPGATTTAPAPEVRRLLLVGDSITQQLAPYVAQALPAVDVRWIGEAGIGPLTDQGRIGDELETAIADLDPDVVVLHFAGSYLERQPDADPYVLANGTVVEDGSDLMLSAWESQSRRLAKTARSRGRPCCGASSRRSTTGTGSPTWPTPSTPSTRSTDGCPT